MERSLRNGSGLHRNDNSLGILNVDNLKGRGRFFGEVSTDSFTNANRSNGSNESGRQISDRLNTQRAKALEALQKSQKGDVFKKPHSVINKENLKSVSNASLSKHLDRSDYVPFRRPHAINISDLVTDETINLETSSCPPSASKDVKVSFEPAEITGRSTLYKRDQKTRNNNNMAGAGDGERYPKARQSVSDILASSFALKARNLCDSLQGGDTTLDSSALVTGGRQVHGISSVSSSTACSSFTSYNGSKSLPRTADLSLSKNTSTDDSFNGYFRNFSSSSDGAGAGVNGSCFSNEEFQPGELMQSKLINDEISWAQEYAAMPAATLSEEAKAKAARTSAVNVMLNGFDSPSQSASNSMIAGDPNFSVGNFFNMRSDNLWNLVNSKSPDKCRTPVALVDDEFNNTVTTTTAEVESVSNISITPKIDNKTYTRVVAASMQKPIETSTSSNRRHESKDSGNSTENSFLLSMSAIDRALCNLDIESDASGVGLSEQLLIHGKKSKSCMNPYRVVNRGEDNIIELASRTKDGSLGADIKLRAIEKSDTDIEKILENKENLDPEALRRSSNVDLSDTMSFTESVLNSSDMKQLQRNNTLPRSPLSPIEVNAAPKSQLQVSVSDGEEADNDEWPGTPITRNRRVRRTKSPQDPRLTQLKTDPEDSPDAITPVNRKSVHSHVSDNISSKVQKSMSSTRLDGCPLKANADCNFAVSPNISNGHLSVSSVVERSKNLAVPQILVQPESPARLDSSPRSYPASYVGSPTPSESVQRLADLDATTNSDRQQLSAGAARKAVSSPVASETSSSCSYGTLQTYRSAISSTSARSVSRCSSSSEFSHHDGKQIPLKVTNMELSWGSVKLRSDSQKSMQIKNVINKRLVIRIEVSGPGYQIVNSQRSNTVTLQSQECRSISISFCPTMRGVAIGKLSFYAPTGGPTIGNSLLEVPLYGYGGNASVIAQNIIFGPVGNPFVTMGNICELAKPLERTVKFFNKGPLMAFAVVHVDSIGLMMPRISDEFEIYPRQMLIPPKSVVNVRVVFRPKREHIKKLIKKMCTVLTMANMRVICGDEPNRQRIRRLLVHMSKEERSKLSSPILNMLWTKFPEELELQDLDAIRENPSVAMDLTSCFRIHDISLTINHENMDETYESTSLYLPDADETLLFRTICRVDSPTPPPSSLSTVDEMLEESSGAEEHVTSTKQGSWSVTPTGIDIDLNHPEMYSLYVHNGFKSRQYFEVACNKKQTLCFAPSEGYVAPDDGQTKIDVGLHTNFQMPTGDVYITVYMENERIAVPVKFHH